MKIQPDEPISTWTGLAYGVVGVLLWLELGTPEAAVMALCLVALTAGTVAMHYRWTEEASRADNAAMNATYLALLTLALGGGAVPMGLAALGGAALEVWTDRPNRVLMGVCVWGGIVAGMVGSASTLTVSGVILMTAGFFFWLQKSDVSHGLWHLLTAPGTALLYLGIAMGA